MTSPGPVVTVAISVTIASISLENMEQCKMGPRMIKITDFPGENVTDYSLKINICVRDLREPDTRITIRCLVLPKISRDALRSSLDCGH